MKILVLSISGISAAGSAASIIKGHMECCIDNCTVEIESLFKSAGPIIDYLIRDNHPVSMDDISSEIIEGLFSEMLQSVIEKSYPDIIICTHPFYIKILCQVPYVHDHDTSVMALIPDFSADNSWVNDMVDTYIVNNTDMKESLKAEGIDDHRILPYGIPVSPGFYTRLGSKHIIDRISIRDKHTILFMGISPGSIFARNITKAILMSYKKIQIIFGGYSNNFNSRGIRAVNSYGQNVRLLDSISVLPEIMSSSDLMITYPCCRAILEAIAAGLPFAVTTALPGTKKESMEYLIKNGLGIWAVNSPEGLTRIVSLIGDGLELDRMRQKALNMTKPYAVSDIAAYISKHKYKYNRLLQKDETGSIYY